MTKESDRHPEPLEPWKKPCEYVGNCSEADQVCHEGREYCNVREIRKEWEPKRRQ